MTSVRMAQVGLAFTAVSGLALACGAEAKDLPPPSLLPELASLQPVLACIESFPSTSGSEVENCITDSGISMVRIPDEPKSAEEFMPLIVATWLYLDRDPTERISSKSLASMLDYARCVEASAYSNKSFSSRTSNGVAEARLQAAAACRDHPLFLTALRPEEKKTASNVRERLLANLMANSALNYALEANGWFPDEMRPCIKYLDGRPPSIGCRLNPRSNLSPPPPPSPPSSSRR